MMGRGWGLQNTLIKGCSFHGVRFEFFKQRYHTSRQRDYYAFLSYSDPECLILVRKIKVRASYCQPK
jgi:hypothetical protein